jgi:SanA protein
MSIVKRFIKIVWSLILLVIAFVIAANIWIVVGTKDQVYDDYTKLPNHRVALVLGTSHRTASGGVNPYFHERIETAAMLYEQGKIDHFILSGDNRSRYYNEPLTMQKALVKRGVPLKAITLDYAGLRTLDSVVRCKVIFGQDKIMIITQPFHSYRALFISRFYNIDAIAMGAVEPSWEYSFRVLIREYLARAKAVLDLYILKTAPRFLGQKEELTIG